MLIFETILALLLGATVLSALARRWNIPYPALLALGGTAITFVPGVPRLDLPPDLILALFVAPVLLDASFDTSLRDLKNVWRPVSSLVLVAVGLTTVAVAFVARQLFPDFPWAAAIALGALLAPPDAVAALAVLKQVEPPHRVRMVLEGESLLNDGLALLIYKLAVGAVAAGGFMINDAGPAFTVVVLGSIAAGWILAWPVSWLIDRSEDAPTLVIYQFVITFGIWLAAERLGLSGAVTIVVFALRAARRPALPFPARLRVSSFAIWETVTVVLNVLAFTLIGLQLRPILDALSTEERVRYLKAALVILAVVIAVRIVWAMTHHILVILAAHMSGRRETSRTAKNGFLIAWAGMRGIVTLAAAMALPSGFPYRDFIQFAAYVVVIGTLGIQGFSLGPLLRLLRLPKDKTVAREVNAARTAALAAAAQELGQIDTPAAQRMRLEFIEAFNLAKQGKDPADSVDNALRRQVVITARRAIDDLRCGDAIGDEAYRLVEAELDWLGTQCRIHERW